MNRRVAVLAGLSLLLLAVSGAGPSAVALKQERVPADDVHESTVRFRGGDRACVIVVGDHNPPSPTDIRVFDTKGRLVAESKSPNDTAAAIWYPVETAPYRIEVRNLGGEYNDLSIYYQGIDKR